MKAILVIRNKESVQEEVLSELLKDYHILQIADEKYEDYFFEVYNAENLDPIDIESLKEKLKCNS